MGENCIVGVALYCNKRFVLQEKRRLAWFVLQRRRLVRLNLCCNTRDCIAIEWAVWLGKDCVAIH